MERVNGISYICACISLQLSEIPLLSVRLDLLFTIKEFPTNIESFQPVSGTGVNQYFLFADMCTISSSQTLDLAWKACKELRSSDKFVVVLRYVLAVGNYLNAGSNKGNAYGFSLNTLTKVSAVLYPLFTSEECKSRYMY